MIGGSSAATRPTGAEIRNMAVGRIPKRLQVLFASFGYQARSWTRFATWGGHRAVAIGRASSVGPVHDRQLDPMAERFLTFHNDWYTAEQGICEASRSYAGVAAVLPRLAGQTSSASTCSRWPKTWSISCARSPCPMPSRRSPMTSREKPVKISLYLAARPLSRLPVGRVGCAVLRVFCGPASGSTARENPRWQ